MPHIEYRVRDWGVPCPRCAASLQLHEFSMGPAGPGQEPRWLVARRYCAAGCVLLARDLDALYVRGSDEQSRSA